MMAENTKTRKDLFTLHLGVILFFCLYLVVAVVGVAGAQYSAAREVDQATFWVDVAEGPINTVVVVGQRVDGYDSDPWASKLESDGTEDWERKYDVGQQGRFNKVIALGNDEYLAVGSTIVGTSPNETRDVLVVFIDGSDGTHNGEYTYGGSEYDEAFDVMEVNGEYVVVGTTASFKQTTDRDFWVFRIDEDGDIITKLVHDRPVSQQVLIGGTEQEVAYAVALIDDTVNDEEFVVAGYSDSSFTAGGKDGWIVVLTDRLEEAFWAQASYGGSGDEVFYGATAYHTATFETAVALVGYEMGLGDENESATDQDLWVVGLDGVYDIDWQRSYYSKKDEVSDAGRDIIELGNGRLLVVGSIGPDDTDLDERNSADMVLLNLDEDDGLSTLGFELFYDSEPGDENVDGGWGVAQASGGGFLVGARTDDNPPSFYHDIWVLRLDIYGQVATEECPFEDPELESEATEETANETFGQGTTTTASKTSHDTDATESVTDVPICPEP